MTNCNRCRAEIKFDDNVRTLSGKAIPLNLDNSKHNCPNSEYSKYNGEDKGPTFTKADQLLEEKTIDNAKWFINGLNDRLKRFKIELVVKDFHS